MSVHTSSSHHSLPSARRQTQHIVAIVQDRPGTLNRIVSVFRRRSLNIQRLTVEPLNEPFASLAGGHGSVVNTSRMSFAVEVADARRCVAELRKMVGVLDLTVETPDLPQTRRAGDASTTDNQDTSATDWSTHHRSSLPQADGTP